MKVCVIGSGSSGNSYLLSEGEHYIVLDCGLPFKQITHSPYFPKFSKIDFVFCSHCHRSRRP